MSSAKTVPKKVAKSTKHEIKDAPTLAAHLVKLFKLKPKHAKSYRTRHYFSLLSLTVVLSLLVIQGLSLAFVRYQSKRLVEDAALRAVEIQTSKQQSESATIVVNSNSGLGFRINTLLYDVEGGVKTGNASGSYNIYSGKDLATSRDYDYVSLKLSDNISGADSLNKNIQLSVRLDKKDFAELAKKYPGAKESEMVARDSGFGPTAAYDTKVVAQTQIDLGGNKFTKLVYENESKLLIDGQKLGKSYTLVYGYEVNKKSLAIVLSGLSTQTDAIVADFERIISTFTVDKTVASIDASSADQIAASSVAITSEKSWLQQILPNSGAQAGDAKTGKLDSQEIVARNAPAVVKIFHVYCGILVLGGVEGGDTCNAVTGSGSIISSDGYIATNGHVVSASAKDVVASSPEILFAIIKLGNPGITNQQAIEYLRNPVNVGTLIRKIYALDESKLYFKNEFHVYTVSLGTKILQKSDFNQIIKDSKFTDTDDIKSAKLIGADYDSADMYSGKFTKSDVAILKIVGSNFPTVKLGSIDGLTTGSALTILGFPAAAESSGIAAESTNVKVKATGGVVSSVLDSNGGGRKVVQSDATISHGNSGGPVFGDDGKVFGLATYSLTPSEKGDGSYSYMRDVKDLKDLAKSKSVNLDENSTTQKTWDEGMDFYYAKKYSKAIKKFEAVQSAYKPHTLAAEFIKISNDKIAKGEEIKDFPIALVAIIVGSVLAVAGIVITIIVMVRHKHKHNLYKATSAYVAGSGSMPPVSEPITGGMQPQNSMAMKSSVGSSYQQNSPPAAVTQNTSMPWQNQTPPQVQAPVNSAPVPMMMGAPIPTGLQYNSPSVATMPQLVQSAPQSIPVRFGDSQTITPTQPNNNQQPPAGLIQ